MKYRELYPKSLSSGTGLIAQLSQKEGIPWKSDMQDISAILERAFGIRYGFKTILDSFAELPESVRADVLAVMYSQKWSRLWDNYLLQYEVLDAYLVTETGNRSVNKDGSDVIKYGKTVNESSSDTGTVDRTENNTTAYGHTVTENGSDSGSINRTDEETLKHGHTVTETGSDSGSINRTDEETLKHGHTVTETGSDSGSINRTDEETLKHGHTVTETGSDAGTIETSASNDNNSTDSVYGFNSPLALPSNTESGTKTSESTETRDLENSKNVTNAGQDEKSVTSAESRDLETSKNVTNAGQDDKTASSTETRDLETSKNVTNAGQDDKSVTSTETRELENSKNVTNAGTDEVDIVSNETRDLTGSRNVTNAGQDSKNHNTTEDEDYSYTKRGNIGYTTPQELIKQDMALWETPFFDIVFSDIDEFIMLQTFTV